MTPAQKTLYWREWSACSKARKAKGLLVSESVRHELHQTALGYHKSSQALTNREFDKVLGVFRSFSRPDDLNAQLHAIEGTEDRRKEYRRRALAAVAVFIHGDDKPHSEYLQDRYLDGVARKVTGTHFDECDEDQLRKVTAIVERRVRQLAKAAAAKTVSEPDPF